MFVILELEQHLFIYAMVLIFHTPKIWIPSRYSNNYVTYSPCFIYNFQILVITLLKLYKSEDNILLFTIKKLVGIITVIPISLYLIESMEFSCLRKQLKIICECIKALISEISLSHPFTKHIHYLFYVLPNQA